MAVLMSFILAILNFFGLVNLSPKEDNLLLVSTPTERSERTKAHHVQ